MVWPTLGSRTAKEQEQLVITADPVCVTVFVVVSLHSWPIDVVHCFFSVFNNKCNMINA